MSPSEKPTIERASGYKDDHMNLPVADVAIAVPFYEDVLGFRVTARGEVPHKSATLARDQVQLRLAENGGDPTQDGVAFHVQGLEALLQEFKARGLRKEISDIDTEQMGGATFRVFYVVAPDGLCYWFGERADA